MESKKIAVTVDDGSGQIKLAYLRDGELVTRVTPSNVQKGSDVQTLDASGRPAVGVWEIDGEIYRVFDKSTGNIVTESTDKKEYQYSNESLALIFNAISSDEYLRDKEIFLGVTLPTTQYNNIGNPKNPINTANIERKKANLTDRKIKNQIPTITTPNIYDVRVIGEGIPAFFYVCSDDNGEPRPEFLPANGMLEHGHLIVDLGKFTADISLINASDFNITFKDSRELGISAVMRDLKIKLNEMAAQGKIPQFAANANYDQLASYLTTKEVCNFDANGTISIADECNEILTGFVNKLVSFIATTAETKREDFKFAFDSIILVGGGAYVIEETLRAANLHPKVIVPESPEKAVALGAHMIINNIFLSTLAQQADEIESTEA